MVARCPDRVRWVAMLRAVLFDIGGVLATTPTTRWQDRWEARLGLAPGSLRLEVEELLVRSGLPVRAKLPAAVWSFLRHDKKARAGRVRWILPRRIGRFSEVSDVTEPALRAAAKVVSGPLRAAR